MQNDTQNITSDDQATYKYEGLSIGKTVLVIIVILFIAIGIITLLNFYKPEAKKTGPKNSIVSVNAVPVAVRDYVVLVSSNGSITAKTNTSLVAQVSGEITQVTNQFTSGANFKKGDLLLTIDKRDFAAAASNAKANLAQAEASLENEKASAEQAKKDWDRLGFSGEPNARVLRKPQLDAAQAQYNAARSSYEKANLDLSRTQIRAPYDGSVVSKDVGLGQFVTVGTPLGNIFSSQGLEISLPVNQEEYAQLDLSGNAAVNLYADLGGLKHQWQGKLIRADQAFNVNTRQLNVTVDVLEPLSNNGLELKIGQYLNANISGRIIKAAKVIPNSSIREGSYVFVFDNGILRRKTVDIIWQDDNNTIIGNLVEGEQVVTTSLSGVVSGSKAKLAGQEKSAAKKAVGKPAKTPKKLKSSS